jgi:hypothetical protein
LENHDFGPAGAKEIGSFLSTNNTITSIDFAENVIGARGAEDLFSALKTNNTLTSINLRLCDIGDEGAEALASLLKTNTSLRSINLENNSIGEDGVKALLPSSKTVSINLRENHAYKMNPKYDSLGVLWEGCHWCKEEGKTNLDPATLVLQVGDNVYVACKIHRGELEKKGDKNKIIDQSSYIGPEDIEKYKKLKELREEKLREEAAHRLKKLKEEAAHPGRSAPLEIETSKGSVQNQENCLIM